MFCTTCTKTVIVQIVLIAYTLSMKLTVSSVQSFNFSNGNINVRCFIIWHFAKQRSRAITFLYWIRSLFFDKIAFRKVHASVVGHLGPSRVQTPTHALDFFPPSFLIQEFTFGLRGQIAVRTCRLLPKLVFRFQHFKLLLC